MLRGKVAVRRTQLGSQACRGFGPRASPCGSQGPDRFSVYNFCFTRARS